MHGVILTVIGGTWCRISISW